MSGRLSYHQQLPVMTQPGKHPPNSHTDGSFRYQSLALWTQKVLIVEDADDGVDVGGPVGRLASVHKTYVCSQDSLRASMFQKLYLSVLLTHQRERR